MNDVPVSQDVAALAMPVEASDPATRASAPTAGLTGWVSRHVGGEVETVRTMVRELIRYRELLVSLTVREIRIRYKQSILGIAWALVLPLAMMLIFTFVFTRAIDLRQYVDVSMPYALFAYLGLLPWVFFATSLTQAVNSLVANSSLLTKIYFPREIFPLASVASALIDFLIGAAVLVVLILYFHLAPDSCATAMLDGGRMARADWTFTLHPTVLLVPLVVLVQIVLTLGLAMLLSMANLFYRDVRHVFAVVIQLWMFLTNVLYPLPTADPVVRAIIRANPMTPIISAYRDLTVYGRLPEFGTSTYAILISTAAFLIGWRCFHAMEFRFAERV